MEWLGDALALAIFVSFFVVIGVAYLRQRHPDDLCRWCGRPIPPGVPAELAVYDDLGYVRLRFLFCSPRCCAKAVTLHAQGGDL